jgi:hypothetical protein
VLGPGQPPPSTTTSKCSMISSSIEVTELAGAGADVTSLMAPSLTVAASSVKASMAFAASRWSYGGIGRSRRDRVHRRVRDPGRFLTSGFASEQRLMGSASPERSGAFVVAGVRAAMLA